MGAQLGTDDKKSVNVELNIVPFIDLMSCLTAFLLVTAVWVNIAQINIQPKGKTRDQVMKETEEPVETLSVLIQHDGIWLGLARAQEFQRVEKTPEGALNWDDYENKLRQIKKDFLPDSKDIEIAGESNDTNKVSYQDVITAMDRAIMAGFEQVGLTDPVGLSARPQM